MKSFSAPQNVSRRLGTSFGHCRLVLALLSVTLFGLGSPPDLRAQDGDAAVVARFLVADPDSPPPAESPLDRAIRELPAQGPAGAPNTADESALDRALRDLPSGATGELSAASAPASAASAVPSLLPNVPTGGGGQLRLIDMSLDGVFAGGSSTERDPSLQSLQGGGHDPKLRGFTIQNVELSASGAVDPYLDAESHIVFLLDPITGDTQVELEEAFITTRSLPDGYQIKAGQFVTEFGRINATHPHAWVWEDQPVIITRVFGSDGMRGPGLRVNKILPVDWFAQWYLGVQNANGDQMQSYLASPGAYAVDPVGGRPFFYRDARHLSDMVYTGRLENSWTTCNDEVTWLLGFSTAVGPNCSGWTGNTQIYGMDLTRKWKPEKNDRGWPFSLWQSEFIVRRFRADNFVNPNTGGLVPSETMLDWGFYTQYLYGCKKPWTVGLRCEYAWGSGFDLDANYQPVGRDQDPYRDNRFRLSPLLTYHLSEFSRFRLQYNFDYAQHLANKTASSVWLGAEFLIGMHPAHKF